MTKRSGDVESRPVQVQALAMPGDRTPAGPIVRPAPLIEAAPEFADWGPTQAAWTDDRVAELRRRWERGESAGQIAAILGGVSRGSVLGKVHRLKLVSPKGDAATKIDRAAALAASRGNALSPLPKSEMRCDPAAAPRGNVVPMKKADGRRDKSGPRSLLGGIGKPDRSPFSTCQYLHGEARDRNFCGSPVLEGPGRRSSYCPEHHALCWREPLPPKAAATPLSQPIAVRR